MIEVTGPPLDLNYRDDTMSMNTALHNAAGNGFIDIVKLILAQGGRYPSPLRVILCQTLYMSQTFRHRMHILIPNYNGNTETSTVTHTVGIKIPCVNPDFVTIQAPASLATQEYTIDSGVQTFDPHSMFTVVTQPV